MFAPNRRREKNIALPTEIMEHRKCLFDMTSFEEQGLFMEGTGSLVLDRQHRKAYAALSERTNKEAVEAWCKQMGYRPVLFRAYQSAEEKRLPIYHTNVMMSIAPGLACICLESIDDLQERDMVKSALLADGHALMELSEAQITSFAGNILALKTRHHEVIFAMSEAAFQAFDAHQHEVLKRFGTPVVAPIPTIERIGGGSVRCMIAEVF
jgi:hypothetical protein